MDEFNDQRRGSTSAERLKPAPSLTEPVTFKYQIQNHTTRIQRLTHAFQVYRLMVLTLICVLCGLVVGLLCRPYAKNWSERQFMYIELPGELYLRFLKLMILPLLVSNVILSFGTIQGKLSSHLGKISSFLYLSSNVVAITVAILLALLIGPGRLRAATGGNHNQFSLDQQRQPGASGLHSDLMSRDSSGLLDAYDESIKRYREYHPMSYHHVARGEEPSNKQQINSSKHPNEQPSTKPITSSSRAAQEDKTSSIISSSETTELKQSSARSQNHDHLLVVLLPQTLAPSIDHPTQQNFDTKGGATSGNGDGNSTDGALHGHLNGNGGTAISAKLPVDVLLDVLRNLVPDSVVGATMQQVRTRLFAPRELKLAKNGSSDPPPSRWPVGHEMVDQPNIVGLLAISILIGVILSHMDEASKPMLDLCSCISELSLRVGMMAIHLTPFCIMFLLIGQVARSRSLTFIASELCMYSITVIVALLIHGLILLPLAYYLVTKKSPLRFFCNMLEALVASFATSSSSATMALVLNCLTDAGLNPVIVRAFGPLGSVFNMNGTAIYEAIGAIFIAQTLGITLPLMSLLLVGFSSAVAGLSTTGIPSSGMVTLVIVLNAINLPVLQLSLIYIVDFIIDRFRTVVNVWSGAIVCGLIDHICPEHLFEEEMKPEKYREILARMRASRGTLGGRRSSAKEESSSLPQVIRVTITPPADVTCSSHI